MLRPTMRSKVHRATVTRADGRPVAELRPALVEVPA